MRSTFDIIDKMKKEIEIPKNCPSCCFELEQINSQLFCRNLDCPAQSTKKVEAFAKKMRIKGLGPANIKKMEFIHPIDLYQTDLDQFIEILGEKIGNKIYQEIDNSKNTTFAKFLAALSIPLIGETASKKLATVANSFLDFMDVENFPIGTVATDNLLDWWEKNDDEVGVLESYFTFSKLLFDPNKPPDSLGKVCITGKLKDFSNRTKAKEILEDHGYTVTSTISSKTNYLVCEEDKQSSKSKKAESLGIPIVTIENLIGKY